MNATDIIRDFLRLTADPVAIAHRARDSDGAMIVWVNDAYTRLLGYEKSELIGQSALIAHETDLREEFIHDIQEGIEAGLESFSLETKCSRKDGSTFWAHLSFHVFPDDLDQGRYSVAVFRDIDALKQREMAAEAALAEQENLAQDLRAARARMTAAIESVPDPFALYDRDLQLIAWNGAYERETVPPEQPLTSGMSLMEVMCAGVECGRIPLSNVTKEKFLRDYTDQDGPTFEPFVLEFAGDRHFRIQRSYAPNGDMVALRTDVTELVHQRRDLELAAKELQRANDRITKLAFHDELTGLGNRRFFTQELEKRIAQRRAHGGFELAVLHIDLDRFKQINDTLGHAAGDHLLREVGARLRAVMPDGAVATRNGGDEFLVLMVLPERSDGSEAQKLAQTLLDVLPRPIQFDGRDCRFGASIGVARTPIVDEDQLLVTSDVALYRAKTSGRGQAAVFDRADLEEMRRIKTLADDVLRGIDAREFVPFYQPLVDAQTGTIVSLEALARWIHPTRGVLAPDEFVAVATDLGAVSSIDQMIFERALEECKLAFGDWDEAPGLSFNVSAKRMLDADILEIGHCAQAYPGPVAFELLETIFLEEQGDAFLMQIDALRDLGITFEIDDFGSGHASIVALRRIGPERLKIERQLITPMTKSSSAAKLVQAIVDIGRALGIGVTAEGVESATHAKALAALGCDRLQGYYFARPMSLEALVSHPLMQDRDARRRA